MALLAGRVARAANGRVLVYVEGPLAEATRADVDAALPAGAEAAPASSMFQDAMGRAGQPTPLGRALDRAAALGPAVKAGAAAAGGADAVVLARTQSTGRGRVVRIVAFDGDGNVIADGTAHLGKKASPAKDAAAVRAILSAPVAARLAAPPPPAPAAPPAATSPALAGPPAAEATAPAAEAESSPAPPVTPPPATTDAHDPTRALLVIAVGGELAARRFDYTDPITTNLRPYSITFAPLAAGSAEVYPLARATHGLLADVGLYGGYARAFGLTSKPAGDAAFDTYYSHFDVGLRLRMRASRHVALGVSAGFGGQDFTFRGSGVYAPEIASVAYRYLRPGVDARVVAGPVAIHAGAAFRGVVSGGNLLARYPHGTVAGIDASLGLGVPIGTSGWEPRLGARYERYFYSMHPEPGDAYIAGGALDQFFTLTLGVAYAL